MRSELIFKVAVAVSVLAHGAALAYGPAFVEEGGERLVKIPILLQEDPPELPPSPPPPPSKPKLAQKPRPKTLPERIEKVIEGKGLRAGELVAAEVGDYAEETEPEPSPPPSPPPPKPRPEPKPEVDTVKLAREFLQELRTELAKHKSYPLAAQRIGITGVVSVSFDILADSTFENLRIKRSSGHRVLDDAALETVRNLSGKLSRPGQLGPRALRTAVVFRYEMGF